MGVRTPRYPYGSAGVAAAAAVAGSIGAGGRSADSAVWSADIESSIEPSDDAERACAEALTGRRSSSVTISVFCLLSSSVPISVFCLVSGFEMSFGGAADLGSAADLGRHTPIVSHVEWHW